jgi:hypothetical protein
MQQIVLTVMHLLDIVFFLGLAGSSVVVVYSFIEDAVELFAKDDVIPPQSVPAPPTANPANGS